MSIEKSLQNLQEAIHSINVFKPAFERIDPTEDLYGPVKGVNTKSDSEDTYYKPCGYWRLSPECLKLGGKMILPYLGDGDEYEKSGALDLTVPSSHAVYGDVLSHFIKSSDTYISMVHRLILPEYFSYRNSTLRYTPYTIYLSKHAYTNGSTWITTSTTSIPANHVKCPKDSDVNYYLQIFKLSVEDMIGIFENMIDRSNDSSPAYITLGTNNLSKLNETQKNIAYRKGWDLQ